MTQIKAKLALPISPILGSSFPVMYEGYKIGTCTIDDWDGSIPGMVANVTITINDVKVATKITNQVIQGS